MSETPSPVIKITLEDVEYKTEIDRIGLQIRKDSTTFSDNATGSIPQIDAIIKTTDGKIYKATQNLNSTYTDYNGNKTTTSNAAEPVGASMCEKFVKEYEWRNQENDNTAQAKVVYGNGIYLSSTVGNIWDIAASSSKTPWSDCKNIYYSKNGKKWNQILLDNAIKTEIPNINEYMISDICYGNGKFVVAIITDEYHLLFGYSTNAIDWTITQSNGLPNNYFISAIKVCYGNNKYSGLAIIGIRDSDSSSLDGYSIYSTDGINWNSNIAKTNINTDRLPYYLVRDICYGNNKFISVVSMFEIRREEYLYDLNDNLYYSTDGINWTSTVALSTFEHLQRIFYINNKFYLCSNMNYAYSTDGITWTKYTPKWSDGTVMDNNSFLSTQIMCKYDNNSLLGLFINHSKNYHSSDARCDILTGYVVCKSTDGITWDKLYNIDLHVDNDNTKSIKGLHPSNMIYVNDSICIVSNSAFMTYTYTRWIHYYWTVNKKDNIELSHIITDQPSLVVCEPMYYSDLDAFSESVTLTKFEEFTEGDLDKHSTGAYRFSGWSQSNITFTKDSPRVTEITGTWNWVDMVKYSYSWNAPSYSDLTGLVTLPTGGSAYVGDTVSVDTKYNSDSKVEVLNWTQGTMPSSQSWSSVCYGNDKFVVVVWGSDAFAYSTDGITWTQGTMPSSQAWYSVCYGNGKFVAISSGSNVFAYSTDGITWTKGTMPGTQNYSSQNWRSVCYGNGKFVAVSAPFNGSIIFAYSTDGITWTKGTIPSIQSWRSVCYGNGKFVVVSNSNVFAYSTDGITWTEGTMPSKQTWFSVCYSNGKFVAIANSTNVFAYLTLPTSYYQFSGWNPSTDFIINENKTISGTWSKKNKLKVSYSWSNQPSGMKSKVPSDEYYHYGDNVMVDTTYNNKSGYKEEMKITENSIDNLNYVAWVTYGNGIYIASQAAYTKDYYRSTDGINWTKYTNASGLQNITFGNDKFVSLGHIGSSKLPQYSSDGINWTNITLPDTNVYWSDIFYGNGKFIGVPTNQNYNIIYSTDGINWASVSVSSNSNAIYYGCGAYCNGVYIIPTQKTNNGSTLTNIYLYSTDGISWSYKTMPSNHFWYSAAASNNLFVMTSGHASIADTAFAYSSDGINWTEITMPSNKYPHIAYGNGYFIVTVYNSNIFYYSSDGINWTEGTLTNSKEWSPVCYGNDEFLMIASTGTCALINLNPTYYQFSGWNKSDFNITADTAVGGSWSQVSAGGGVNFSELNTTSFGSRYAYGCIYAFDKYIVVGGDYRESTNFISYSNDCKSFTAIKPLSGSGSTFFSDLTFGNNILIATKRNGEYNYIARTTDGVNWTIVTISNTSRNWYSAVYGANKFVLFSNGYIAYSTDAINWTEKANAITINGNGCGPGYHSVIYDGQKFWARVNYQLKYCYSYSTDGINWTTTQVSQPWGNGSPSIYYCNGYSICYTSGNKGFKLYVSNDNITFTEHYSRADASNGWVYSNIIDYNGMYMFTLSTNSTGKIYLVYSTDLYNWNEFLIVEDTSILPICKAVYCDPNGKVFTVTSNHSNLYSFNISRLILIN